MSFSATGRRGLVHHDDVPHPKDIGDRSTLAIMLALQAEGSTIYVPFGENSRCDLVVDDGVRLIRIQCKTGRLTKGSVESRVRPAPACEVARVSTTPTREPDAPAGA